MHLALENNSINILILAIKVILTFDIPITAVESCNVLFLELIISEKFPEVFHVVRVARMVRQGGPTSRNKYSVVTALVEAGFSWRFRVI